MKAKLLAATILFMAIGISNSDAQTWQYAKNERSRIKGGVKSGELTRNETKNLVNDQKEIRQEVKAAKADGKVTKCERKNIRHDQRQASYNIYRKKHNCRDKN